MAANPAPEGSGSGSAPHGVGGELSAADDDALALMRDARGDPELMEYLLVTSSTSAATRRSALGVRCSTLCSIRSR